MSSYPAQTDQAQKTGQPVQAQPVQVAMPAQPMQPMMVQAVAVPIGPNSTMQQIELQNKASSVFRVWCCSLTFGIITLISGLIAGGQKCGSSDTDANNDYSFCDGAAVWRLYAPGIAFGGGLTVISVLALRALHCTSCTYNLDIPSYDMRTLRPLLWIALIPGVGVLIWSAVYLIAFNYFAVILFPYFIPCWAGCVLGILSLVQACCCQRQMHMSLANLNIVGNAPPTMIVQPQFVQQQYQPQYGQPQQYGQQYGQQYVQQGQFVPQQQGMQPQYFAPYQQQQQQQYMPQQQQFAQQQFVPQQQITGDTN